MEAYRLDVLHGLRILRRGQREIVRVAGAGGVAQKQPGLETSRFKRRAQPLDHVAMLLGSEQHVDADIRFIKGEQIRLGAVLLPGVSQIGDDGIHQLLHLVRGDMAPVRAPRGAGRFPLLIRLHFPQGDFWPIMMPRFRSGANWCAIAAETALSEWRVTRPEIATCGSARFARWFTILMSKQ